MKLILHCFTDHCFTVCFNLGRRNSAEPEGVRLGKDLTQKCLYFIEIRHDNNFLGKKYLISTYFKYTFMNTICSCLIYSTKSLILESFQLSKYQKNPISGIKMNHFPYHTKIKIDPYSNTEK